MTTPYHRAAVTLRHARSVVICAHVSPDGDAVGAVLGLTLALRDAGIAALPTLADDAAPPAPYAFLPGFSLYTAASELETPDVFVAVDTPNMARLGVAQDLARDAETVVVVDHHPDNLAFGTVNVLDPGAAACGQMVWRLLSRLEIEPSPEVALCCYVGLVTDTGRFQYDNTDPAALREAADMVEAGVDPAEVARYVYESRSPGAMALDAVALSRLAVTNGGRVAYAWVEEADFERTGAREEETEHLVDEVRVVQGIDVAALLRLRDGQVRVNLRAKTGFDVGTVARSFGGGGHAAAAGFTYDGRMDDLLGRLLPMLPGAGED